MKPHKWHKEIVAWASGAEIEKWMLNDTWQVESRPSWHDHENYRIKPQPKEPQPKPVQYLYVYMNKQTGNPVIELDKPNYILDDDEHKYLGKIKLEDELE